MEVLLPASLNFLILEDDAADFELFENELRRFGFTGKYERAETEIEFLKRLHTKPDVIVANYVLKGFDALRALELLQQSGLITPFIVVTDTVDEETVVECLKRGAADYLRKDRASKLGPAVKRAIEEVEVRRQKRATEQALRQKSVELEDQCRRLQEASRMKSTFLSNMSHELRTPLTAIIGFTELLVDGKVGHLEIPQFDLLQDILGNGKHLLGLINDVLDLAKVESGTMLIRPERTSISEIVGETMTGLRLFAMERKISLKTDLQLPATDVFLDPQRLKQVLLNYISNALKFTPPGGSVTVRVLPEGRSFFRLEVEDTGNGIAPQDISRLFHDFQQLDESLGVYQGTGLGLAVTKRLVEAQGGNVGVASVRGKGSTFFAVLPYAAEREERGNAPISIAEATSRS
jgi:signal transduction histidine kinase